MSEHEWDVFICHASEDKDEIAGPLAAALKQAGLRVWYDEDQIRLGDSLRSVINDGLAKSKRGVVILSPNFFAKNWPQVELDGLFSRRVNLGESRVVLPVLHKMSFEELSTRHPTLSDIVGEPSKKRDGTSNLESIVRRVIEVVRDVGALESSSTGENGHLLLPESGLCRLQATVRVVGLSRSLSRAELHKKLSSWQRSNENELFFESAQIEPSADRLTLKFVERDGVRIDRKVEVRTDGTIAFETFANYNLSITKNVMGRVSANWIISVVFSILKLARSFLHALVDEAQLEFRLTDLAPEISLSYSNGRLFIKPTPFTQDLRVTDGASSSSFARRDAIRNMSDKDLVVLVHAIVTELLFGFSGVGDAAENSPRTMFAPSLEDFQKYLLG